MKNNSLTAKRSVLPVLASILLVCCLAFRTIAAPPKSEPIPAGEVKNVVIVHGAFADGSGFKKLYKVLSKKGYQVTIVQNPLTSLKDDVDATRQCSKW
jgi:hypothetical protein